MSNIVIRVDGGKKLGMGHMMRCRNLAELLIQGNHHVTFVSKEHDRHLIDILDPSIYSIIRLKLDPSHSVTSDTSTWLGDTIEGELDQLVPELVSSIDLLIIDHYGIDYRWEKAIKKQLPNIKKILVIDDLHDRKHSCDYLLDYTYREGNINPYRERKLISKHCQTFLGLDYVLLNQLFHQTRRTTNADSIRINISFGGSDLHNLTTQITRVLLPIFGNRVEYIFDIILGNLYSKKDLKILEQFTQTYVNFNLYQSLNFQEITELLSQTDLSIGAGGVSIYERCCLGIPSIIITLAENQKQNAQNLAKLGVVTHLGSYQNWNPRDLINAIDDRKLIAKQSRRCQDLIDGLGCQRIIDLILP